MLKRPNKWLDLWDTVVMAFTVFAALEIPLRLSLGYVVTQDMQRIDMLLTLIFALDIFLRFNTAIMVERKEVTDRRAVAWHYMSGWFVVDLLATIPFDLLVGSMVPATGTMFHVLRALRVLRVLRLARLARTMHDSKLHLFMHPSLVRLVFFLFWVAVSAHWIACGWLALGGVPMDQAHLVDTYVEALYWTVTTLTTVGYGDITPETNAQKIFTMIIMSSGVAIYGYVIGNVATLLTNLDIERERHVQKMDQVNAFMRSHRVPFTLQERVRSYYRYVWETRSGKQDHELLTELPPSLRTDVALHLNREIIERIPLFAGAEPSFIRQLVANLRPIVFVPGDMVIRRGELGHEMFFVNQGELEVLGEDDHDVISVLSEGDFFGELSLLHERPRIANIRAMTYCELFTIDKALFHRILNRFPEFAERMEASAYERQGTLSGQYRARQAKMNKSGGSGGSER